MSPPITLPVGGYAVDGNFFTTELSSGPLRALANGAEGGNGVYRYVAGGGFPTDSFNAGNYWVDVSFSNTLGDLVAPTVTAQSPDG